jgi:hypothetical protein
LCGFGRNLHGKAPRLQFKKAPRLQFKLAWLVDNQAFAAFPSMAIGQEDLAAILFVIAIVGIAFGALLTLFLLFCDQHRGTTNN